MHALAQVPLLLQGEMFAVVGVIILVVFLIFAALFAARYTKVGPNEVLIISGKRGFRTVKGGGTFVWPVIEMVQVLSLELLTIEIHLDGVYTVAGVPVAVDGVAQIKVRGDEVSIRTAAEQFLGKRVDEIRRIAHQSLEGHLRAIVGTLTVEEIYKNRDAFSAKVAEQAVADMANMGLTIVSFTVREVKDSEGYLDALGRPRIAQVLRDAEIAEAQAQRDARMKKAEADRDARTVEATANQKAEEARYEADARIAESKRDYEVKQAEYDRATNLKRAEADLAHELQTQVTMQAVKEQSIQVEVVERQKMLDVREREIALRGKELEANVHKPAEAERFRIQQLAEAERFRREAEAQGQANAERAMGEGRAAAAKAQGLAQADVIVAQGQAEAEAMARKAQAWSHYNEAAILDMLIARLPEIAAAIAKPLENMGTITVVDMGGDSGGASRVTGDIVKVLAQLPPAVKGLSGVDLLALFQRLPGLGGAAPATGGTGDDADGQG